uniref:Uncharacterized protein n=1 Tax=Arundo donax TaxID=35708 RepID=A0A0A9HPT8_ARUDO
MACSLSHWCFSIFKHEPD